MNQAWNLVDGQHPQSFERSTQTGAQTRFLLYLPPGYQQSGKRKWPLIIFLHGSGERGDDLEKVKAHGPPALVEKQKDFSFIVASPQAPAGTNWNSEQINELLDELVARLAVDVDRVYLTGLSLGGHGTWNIGARQADRFAAIAPVCGAGDVKLACQLKTVPIWAFHGAKDPVVSLASDQRMVDAVKACGGDVTFTVYPEVGHEAWTPAYADPALYQWLLQHKRSDRP